MSSSTLFCLGKSRAKTFVVAMIVILLSVALFFAAYPAPTQIVWADNDKPYVVKPYGDYGLPDDLGDISFYKQFDISQVGSTYKLQIDNSATAVSYSTMAAVVSAIESSLGSPAASVWVRINFNNIVMAKNESFTIAKAGSYLVSGSLTGDKSDVANTGVLNVKAGTTSWQQNVYLNGLTLINNGSWNRAATAGTTTDPDASLGLQKPNGLYVASSGTGFANVFVLSGSSIKVTNNVFREKYSSMLYDTQSLGYASTSSAHNDIGAAGYGKTLSFAFQEIPKGKDAHIYSYPDQIENAKSALLEIAYGIDGSRDITKYNAYKNELFDTWVKSPDFKDIYTSYTGTPAYLPTSPANSQATYTISVRQPSTGNAIAFASSGSLVIDTDGEISNYGADTSTTVASATVQMTNTAWNNNASTRLYVKNGEIINYYFGLNYLRTYNRAASSWETNTWSISDVSMEIATGHCFALGYTAAANAKGSPKDLLEGGSYMASGLVTLINASTSNSSPIVTVGRTDGTGPVMQTGYDADKNSPIRFIATQAQTPNTQYMINNISGGFHIYTGGISNEGSTAFRSDFVFLGGELTSHRNAALFFTTSSAYDVHLAGGKWKSGSSYTMSTGFIINNSVGAATGNISGSTVFTYGENDSFIDRNSSNVAVQCAGFTIEAAANYYATNTTTQVGLFQANATSGTAPSFVIKGGKFTNTDPGAYSHIFTVTGTAPGRDVLIEGGEFYTNAGSFIWMYSSDKNVVMTGGRFENTGSVACTPVVIGNYTTSISTSYTSHDPSGYRTYDSTGKLVNSTQGFGGKGILYLNGGEIISNNSNASVGLISVAKSNNTTALVMGLKPAALDQSGNKGYDETDKAQNVTKITNKGSSPMIRVVPGINGATTVTIDGAGRTVRYYAHSNSTTVIDRINFEYSSFSNITSPSISLPQILPEVTYPINFAHLIFTGTLAAGSGYSGLIGRIQAGVNNVELASSFNDVNFNSEPGKEYVLDITNINEELALNGRIITNYRGDGIVGTANENTGWYKAHFRLYTAIGTVTRAAGMSAAGYAHDGVLVDAATADPDGLLGLTSDDWKVENKLFINWYTQKGVDALGEPVSKSAAAVKNGGTFSANNIPAAYDPSNVDLFRKNVYRVDDVPSYFTYEKALKANGYVGETFTDGVSEGMPKLTMAGYTHIGWTYSGNLSPYFSTSGLWATGVYTTAVAQDMYVKAEDSLKSYFDHFLVAVWTLENPKITPSTEGALSYLYGDDKSVTLKGEGTHPATAYIDLNLTFSWFYKAVDATEFTSIGEITSDSKIVHGSIQNIKNVRQNGEYKLVLTASDDTYPVAMTASVEYTFTVDIKPKLMTADNIRMPSVKFDDATHSPLDDYGSAEDNFHFVEIVGGEPQTLNLVDGTVMDENGIFDFTVTPGLNARFSGMRPWAFYFNFFGNYAGSNVHVDFIIWGDMTVTFGNLKNASVSPSQLLADDFDYLEDGSRLYPRLPVPTAVNGYTFSHWSYNGEAIYEGMPATKEYSYVLLAVWTLNAPSIVTTVNDTPSNSLLFEYDRLYHSMVARATVGSPAISGISYTYSWEKAGVAEAPVSGVSSLTMVNVIEQTQFLLTVTAYDGGGLSSHSSKTVTVQVTPKEMASNDIKITAQPYDGNAKVPTITIVHTPTGYTLQQDTDYDIVSIPEGPYINAKSYPFIFNFKGNYSGTGITQNFVIYTNVTLSFGNLKPGVSPDSAVAPPIALSSMSNTYPELPSFSDIKGYEFLGWIYNGVRVKAGDELKSVISHTLLADWALKVPTVSLSEQDLSFIYDRSAHGVTASANIEGITTGIVFTYSWTRLTNANGSAFSGTYSYSGATAYFTNVADSGTYNLTVTATDGLLYSETLTAQSVEVTISPKNIGDGSEDGGTISDVKVSIPVVESGSGSIVPVISMIHMGTLLQLGETLDYVFKCYFTSEYELGDTSNEISTIPGIGNYTLVIIGKNNYDGTREQGFSVDNTARITFVTAIGTIPTSIYANGAFDIRPIEPPDTKNYYPALPNLNNVEFNPPGGYEFIGWVYMDGGVAKYVGFGGGSGDDRVEIKYSGSHVLTATWRLNAIDVSFKDGIDSILGDYVRSGYSITAQPNITGAVGILYTYQWIRQSDRAIVGTASTLTRTNHEDEYYDLVITATGLAGLVSTATVEGIHVQISPRAITDSAISIYMPDKNIPDSMGKSTLEYSIAFDGVRLVNTTEYTLLFLDTESGEYITELPLLFGVGTYTFKFVGNGNFTDEITIDFQVISVVVITFYTQLGTAPSQIVPNGSKYPELLEPTNKPDGYTFIKWQYNGNDLPANGDLAVSGSHLLAAVWVLNEIILTNESEIIAGISGMYTSSGYSLTALPAILGDPTGILYTYEWRLGGKIVYSGQKLTAINVVDSGVYTLTITAMSSFGLASVGSYTLDNITVNISPRPLTDSAVAIFVPDKTLSGSETSAVMDYTVTYGGSVLANGKDFGILYYNGSAFVSTLPQVFTTGSHTVRFVGSGNFASFSDVTFRVISSAVVMFFTQIGDAPSPMNISGTKYGVLAAPTPVAGYEFLYWSYASEEVKSNSELKSNASHTLTAVWKMNNIIMSNAATLNAGITGGYTHSGYTLSAEPYIYGNQSNTGILFTYEWRKSGTSISTSATLSVINVSDSGTYTLIVKAVGLAGIQATDYTKTDIAVAITPKSFLDTGENAVEIDIPEKIVGSPTATATLQYTITYENALLRLSGPKEYEILIFNGTNYVPITAQTYAVGTYMFRFVGSGNYSGQREIEFKVVSGNVQITFYSMLSGVTLPPAVNIAGELISGKYALIINNASYKPTNIPAGYRFESWQLNGADITLTDDILMHSHTLSARYSLEGLSIDAISAQTYTFDWAYHTVTATGRISGKAVGESGYTSSIMLTYSWQNGSTVRSGAILTVRNVNESGNWVLTVTATDTLYGLSISMSSNVTVTINAASLAAFEINAEHPSALGQITVQQVVYSGYKYTRPMIFVKYDGTSLYSYDDVGASADYRIEALGSETDGYMTNPGIYRFKVAAVVGGNFSGYIEVEFEIINVITVSFYTQLGNTPLQIVIPDDRYPSLPVPISPDGYTFVKWQYNGSDLPAANALAVQTSHLLTAVWRMNDIVMDNTSELDAGINGVYTRTGYTLTAAPSIVGNPSNAGVLFTYEWKRNNVVISTSATLSVTNVSDSGTYTLTVKAVGLAGIQAANYVKYGITVTINPKSFGDTGEDAVVIDIPVKTISNLSTLVALQYTITYENSLLKLSAPKEYEIYYNGVLYTPAMVFGEGGHTFRFIGSGNYTGFRDVDLIVSEAENVKITFYSMLTGITLTNETADIKDFINGKYALIIDDDDYKPSNIPAGYKFESWQLNSVDIKRTDDIPMYSHILTARYSLENLNIDAISDQTSFTFDWTYHTITATGRIGGKAVGESGYTSSIMLTYSWQKGSTVRAGATLTVRNVNESGNWVLTVTATDTLYGLSISRPTNITVTINAVSLAEFEINAEHPSESGQITVHNMLYVGSKYDVPTIFVMHDGNLLINESVSAPNADYNLTALSSGAMIYPGTYMFRIEAAAGGNFTGYIDVPFVIKNTTTIYFHSRSEVQPLLTDVTGIPYSVAPTDENEFPVLPVPSNVPVGYKFKGWAYESPTSEIFVHENQGITTFGAIHLFAVWELDKPVLSNYTSDFDDYIYTYSGGMTLKLDVGYSEILVGSVKVTYRWQYSVLKDGSPIAKGNSENYFVQNVADSGYYTLTVTLTDEDLEIFSSQSHTFKAIILPKQITSDMIQIASASYSGVRQAPDSRIMIDDGEHNLTTDDYILLNQGNEYINAVDYTVGFRFRGNYTQESDAVYIVYTIAKYKITFTNNNGLTVQSIFCTEDGKYSVLPQLTGISGYTFKGWEYVGANSVEAVSEGDPIKELHAHSLRAIWAIDAPVVTASDISGEYKWTAYSSVAKVELGSLKEGIDYDISYAWVRKSDSSVVSTTATLSVINVAESGSYTLTVTVNDKRIVTEGQLAIGITSIPVEVNITPKALSKENVTVQSQTFTGTGIKAQIIIKDGDNVLEIEYDFVATLPDGTNADGYDFVSVGDYKLLIDFMGNFTGTAETVFEVEKSRSIIEMWWLWLVITLAVAIISFVLWFIYEYLKQKRKKYGMKRHIHSFMDDFDVNA